MLIRLILLFTIVPLIELALLIEIGQTIGLANTLIIVIVTGIAGASLARSQGFGILQRIQNELQQGQIPGESLLDGVLILAGALLLLTPGLITDVLGLALLLPFSRVFVKTYLINYFRNKFNKDEIKVRYKIDDDLS